MMQDLARIEAPLVIGASPGPAPGGRLTRRNILKLGFWTSLGALAVSASTGVLNSLYPRGVTGFGGPVAVKAIDVPVAGAPPKPNFDGHFLLVNLAPGEGRIASDETATDGGLLALWWKCPHLGCTIPWKTDFISPYDALRRRGWFNCNCHGSTYTKAGVRVFGPATRSMDTMQLTVAPNGDLTVQTGKIRGGGIDNAQRAMAWTPPA